MLNDINVSFFGKVAARHKSLVDLTNVSDSMPNRIEYKTFYTGQKMSEAPSSLLQDKLKIHERTIRIGQSASLQELASITSSDLSLPMLNNNQQ